MKRKLFLIAALFLSVSTACVTLTSCDKEDEETTTDTQKQDTKPAFVQMTFTFNATQDMIDNCDMVVKYNDGTGEKTETVTSLEWNKTLKVALPATLTFSREVTLKAGIDVAAIATISHTKGYGYNYVMLNAQGEKLGKSGIHSSGNHATISGTNFVTFVGEGRLNSTHSYSFDANGDLVD